jgi:hypothetical protein
LDVCAESVSSGWGDRSTHASWRRALHRERSMGLRACVCACVCVCVCVEVVAWTCALRA